MFWRRFADKRKDTTPPTWWYHLQGKSRLWGLSISRWLQRKTATVPPGRLKIYCMLVLLIFASWNAAIIVQALKHQVSPAALEQIRIPNQVVVPDKESSQPDPVTQLKDFRTWLDSLKKDSAGQKIYNRILQERPGLLDNLRQREKMYFNNF